MSLQVPATTVEAKWAVFWVKLTYTATTWVLVWVLVEKVLDTQYQLRILGVIVSNLCINQSGCTQGVTITRQLPSTIVARANQRTELALSVAPSNVTLHVWKNVFQGFNTITADRVDGFTIVDFGLVVVERNSHL